MIVSKAVRTRQVSELLFPLRRGSWTGFFRSPATFHRSPRCGVRQDRGFTLIELLVVITIILIISAIALPTVLPALSHRQVSEAARTLQAALVGARDAAIRNNAPSGIRLLPDPAFLTRTSSGQIDPTQALACNRIIPIEPAPTYSEGLVNVNLTLPADMHGNQWTPPLYPFDPYGIFYYPVTLYKNDANNHPTIPVNPNASVNTQDGTFSNANVLMIEESVYNTTTNALNAPTSWYWNIRVGDKIQINNSGPWYTVVGPLSTTTLGNPEQFVNVGPPGTQSTLFRPITSGSTTYVYPEYLLVVNGNDDNSNGWTDEGYDGVDNDGILINGNAHTDDLAEWEYEAWPNSITPSKPLSNGTYIIQRRPAPSSNAREVSLPPDVVVDLTTSFYPNSTTPSLERSRLPVNQYSQYSGYVDILLNPNGTVVPTTTTFYSSPTSASMTNMFYHFWLSERQDVAAPSAAATTAPYLPIGLPPGQNPATFSNYQFLKGDYRLLTLFTRSGQILTDEDMVFDNPLSPAYNNTYNVSYPFLGTQLGLTGGF